MDFNGLRDVEALTYQLDRLAASPFVADAVIATADGLAKACNASMDSELADTMAAVTCGLQSLAVRLPGAPNVQVVIENRDNFIVVMACGTNSHLAAISNGRPDIGKVGYAMTQTIGAINVKSRPRGGEA